jgi:hypothetical protein
VFIKNNPEYPVAKWAEILQIERTGNYAWASKREALEKREEQIKQAIKNLFKAIQGIYGPTRITIQLRKKGELLMTE